jgi:hypothetical protein
MVEICTIARMEPQDFLTIGRQPSQRVCLYGDEPNAEAAEVLASQAESYSVRDLDGRLIACMGIAETFIGRVGLVWAVLSERIGIHHLAISRFARQRIGASKLGRIEALARARDVEPFVATVPDATPAQIVSYALAQPTPECRWPALLGLTAVHVVRRFGALGESYMLFERVRVAALPDEWGRLGTHD